MWKPEKIYGEIIYWGCSKCDFALDLNGDDPKKHQFYYCPKCGYKHIRPRTQTYIDNSSGNDGIMERLMKQ